MPENAANSARQLDVGLQNRAQQVEEDVRREAAGDEQAQRRRPPLGPNSATISSMPVNTSQRKKPGQRLVGQQQAVVLQQREGEGDGVDAEQADQEQAPRPEAIRPAGRPGSACTHRRAPRRRRVRHLGEAHAQVGTDERQEQRHAAITSACELWLRISSATSGTRERRSERRPGTVMTGAKPMLGRDEHGHAARSTASPWGRRRARLSAADAAVRRARARGEILAWHHGAPGADVDPAAVAFASRRARRAVVLLRAARPRRRRRWPRSAASRELEAHGPGPLHRRSRARGGRSPPRRSADAPDGPPGADSWPSAGSRSPPTGGAAPHWAGFPPASLHVPEVALARRGDDVRLTLAALADARRHRRRSCVARLEARARRAARRRRCRCWTRSPPGASASRRSMPPEHYEAAVARAVERIRAGGSTRSCSPARSRSTRPRRTTRPPCSASCARRFPSCLRVLRRPRRRRVRRRLARAARAPRGPARLDGGARRLDPPLGRPGRRRPPRRAAAALRQGPRGAGDRRPPHRAHAAAARGVGHRADEPAIVKIANIQHLGDADPRAARRSRCSAIELAGLLHPTPAVGGEPLAVAAPLIPALEGLDRGWYAGPVGWTDANEDGEFCVALRCALLRGRVARLLRRRRRRARLRSGGRAGGDRGQAAGAAARPVGLISGRSAASSAARRAWLGSRSIRAARGARAGPVPARRRS